MAQTLGPYEIRGEIGRGAMAVVWRGYDANLEREVAIKEPTVPAGTDSATSAELGARFVREGKAAAKLNHPGVVTIYASDIYDGRPCIVMELIEGETLADILDRGPLGPDRADAIADQLLDAAGYAHSRGIVHRDIKPDNVFVTRDGRVKLADFGIAHTGAGSTLTQAGAVMGTPGYMAPEQVTGSQVDERADIFAIGVILFEMLTGSNPFGATDGTAPTTVMYRIVHEAAPSVSHLQGPGAEAALVALNKDPNDRFQSAQEMRAVLGGTPSQRAVVPGSARPPGASQAAMPLVASPTPQQTASTGATTRSLNPGLVAAIVGAAAILLAALFVFSGGPGSSTAGTVPVFSAEATGESGDADESSVLNDAYIDARYTLNHFLHDDPPAGARMDMLDQLSIVGLAVGGVEGDMWATAIIVPAEELMLDSPYVVMHDGGSGWEVISFGTGIQLQETGMPADLHEELWPPGSGAIAQERLQPLSTADEDEALEVAYAMNEAKMLGEKALAEAMCTPFGVEALANWPMDTPARGYPDRGSWDVELLPVGDGNPCKDGFWTSVGTMGSESGEMYTHGAIAVHLVEVGGEWFVDDAFGYDPWME